LDKAWRELSRLYAVVEPDMSEEADIRLVHSGPFRHADRKPFWRGWKSDKCLGSCPCTTCAAREEGIKVSDRCDTWPYQSQATHSAE
jgi:hypothetical protein